MANLTEASEDHAGSTRQRLLLAAGELFAERGFEAVGTREILEKAEAHSAAVHYHYGSKLNLYHEAIRYVLQRFVAAGTSPVALVHTEQVSPEELAETLSSAIHGVVQSYLSPMHPRWYVNLILRGMNSGDPATQEIVREVLAPQQETLKSIVRAVAPDMSERRVNMFAYSITGQVTFYAFARGPIEAALGEDGLKDGFLEELSDHVSRLALAGLGLPLPDMTS